MLEVLALGALCVTHEPACALHPALLPRRALCSPGSPYLGPASWGEPAARPPALGHRASASCVRRTQVLAAPAVGRRLGEAWWRGDRPGAPGKGWQRVGGGGRGGCVMERPWPLVGSLCLLLAGAAWAPPPNLQDPKFESKGKDRAGARWILQGDVGGLS